MIDAVKISGQSKLNSDLKIELINSIGQIVEVSNVNGSSGSFVHQINTLTYSKGIYYVRVSDEKHKVSNQFLIK